MSVGYNCHVESSVGASTQPAQAARIQTCNDQIADGLNFNECHISGLLGVDGVQQSELTIPPLVHRGTEEENGGH